MAIISKFRKAIAFYFLRNFHKKEVPLQLSEAVVSFTFDDVPRSAIENGSSILKKYGYCGTFYVAIEMMSKEGFDLEGRDAGMLNDLINEGNELACHTYSHLHFFRADEEKIHSDLKKNQEVMEKLVPGYKLRNISYPFGEQTLRARDIVKKRFRSARSIYKGVNSGKTDLNCLRSIRLYESISIERNKSMVDLAIKDHAWLIFYTHDVMDNPSEIGCSPKYFEEIVKYCHQKGIRVLTIDQALDMAGA